MIRLFALLLATTLVEAQAQQCHEVTSGQVSFTVEQMGAPFTGEFTEFGGELCLDGNTAVAIDVWLRPASVDTGLADLDMALQGPELFHSERFDRVTYVSTDVRAEGDGYRSNGTLSMKGIRRPLAVDFDLMNDGDIKTVNGAAELDRLEFEVGIGEWGDTDLLGGPVAVDFSVVLD